MTKQPDGWFLSLRPVVAVSIGQDPGRLTTFQHFARLKETGVVGVREGEMAVASTADFPTADVEHSPSGTNR